MEDCYKILGVAANADKNEIKRAYFSKVKIFTPEKNPDEFKRLKSAYETLGDENKRAELDRYCGTPEKTKEKLLEASRLLEDEKYEEALKVLNGRGKKHFEIEKRIIEVKLEQGDYDEALKLAEKLADNHRSNQGVHMLLAQIYESQDSLTEADEHYRLALSLDEGNETAWVLYTDYLIIEKSDKIIDLLERLKKLGGDFLKKHRGLYSVYLRLHYEAVGTDDEDMDDLFVECYEMFAKEFMASRNEKWIRSADTLLMMYAKSPKLYETSKVLADFMSLNYPKLENSWMKEVKTSLEFAEARSMKDMHKVLINLSVILNVGINSTSDLCMRHIYESYIFEHVNEILPYIERLEKNYPKMFELNQKFYQSLRNPRVHRVIMQKNLKDSYQLKKKNPQFFKDANKNTVYEDSPLLCLAANEEVQHIFQNRANVYNNRLIPGRDERYIQALETYCIAQVKKMRERGLDEIEYLNMDDEELIEFGDLDDLMHYVASEVYSSPFFGSTVHREGRKIGRNELCPCGSMKKYKHCCGRNA
jgi:curved DNA-binding protein CbpA